MQRYRSSILILVSILLAGGSVSAGETVPAPVGDRLPIVKASLDDGFYALAEQQARGVLRSDADPETRREATLLLAHSLWGQKRYSELLALLAAEYGKSGTILKLENRFALDGLKFSIMLKLGVDECRVWAMRLREARRAAFGEGSLEFEEAAAWAADPTTHEFWEEG